MIYKVTVYKPTFFLFFFFFFFLSSSFLHVVAASAILGVGLGTEHNAGGKGRPVAMHVLIGHGVHLGHHLAVLGMKRVHIASRVFTHL